MLGRSFSVSSSESFLRKTVDAVCGAIAAACKCSYSFEEEEDRLGALVYWLLLSWVMKHFPEALALLQMALSLSLPHVVVDLLLAFVIVFVVAALLGL